MSAPKTLFEKVWDGHVVTDLGEGEALLFVDRHMLHDLTLHLVLPKLAERGYQPFMPELCTATADHAISSEPGRQSLQSGRTRDFVHRNDVLARDGGIRFFGPEDSRQGIVHVIGPELGLSLPGTTIVCTDSHTCTQGAFGAMAWGIGTSTAEHIMATQTIVQKRPLQMRVNLDGQPGAGVSAKDVVLALIGQYGAAGGSGYAIEFAGSFVRSASMDERMTLCNMAVEFGANTGMIGPDDTTFDFLAGREFSPKGQLWDQACAEWALLATEDGAEFDREISLDVGSLGPCVTYGTNPEQVLPIDEPIPAPSEVGGDRGRHLAEALEYMGLEPGRTLENQPIEWAFIGSCTNSRLSDLRSAADVVKGRRVAEGVQAWVVPGSTAVKIAAEAEGLDRIFTEAGFSWRESSCSLCCSVNGDIIAPGQRCISTSNRNYLGRQGPGARTHLASPVVVAASAIAGCIADPRKDAK